MRTWVEISKKKLLHNVKEIKKLLKPEVFLMAVVKSNAYGHGIKKVSKIVNSKIDLFGVDSIDEALILKKNGIKKPILILGYIPLDRLKEAVKNKFRLVVYNHETIKALIENSKLKTENQINVHIKVETGTSRQGMGEDKILKFVKFIKKIKNINIEGIYTHFANIEDTTNHTYAQKQLDKFKKIIKLLEKQEIEIPIRHTACSAATILFSKTHFNLVRLGIAMYGLWPSKETLLSFCHSPIQSGNPEKKQKNMDFPPQTGENDNMILEPALAWKTVVAQVKNIKKGTPISYGLTEKVNRNSKIAVLPIGYWDGFDRGLSSIGNVLIKGKRCKLLGRVCMNMCVVDVTDVKNVKPEDEVVIIGKQGKEQITAEEFAEKTGTINYEVVTRINPLIKRVII